MWIGKSLLIYDLYREVSMEEGEKKASDTGIMFIETSAKAGYNVKTLFKRIAQTLPGMEAETGNKEQSKNVSVFLIQTNC